MMTVVVEVAVIVVKMQVAAVIVVDVLQLVLGGRVTADNRGGGRLEIDLEFVSVSHVKRMKYAIGQLELFGAKVGHELAGFGVDVKELELGCWLTYELFQLLFKVTHRLPHVHLVVHALITIVDLDLNPLADVKADVGQLVQLTVLALELVVSLKKKKGKREFLMKALENSILIYFHRNR